jgi:hypothetical protein
MSMKKQEGVAMDDMTLDLTFPFGVSGAFLMNENRFLEIHRMTEEFSLLSLRLQEVEAKIGNCSNSQWLISFRKQCHRLRRDHKRKLVELADSLEIEKSTLTAKKDETRQKLLRLEPTALDSSTLARASYHNPFPFVHQKQTRGKNTAVEARNAAIDCLLHLPNNRTICEHLDDEFPPTKDRPAPQFPDPWFRKFGVMSFVEAYHKCPHLVHSMIGKRRREQSP